MPRLYVLGPVLALALLFLVGATEVGRGVLAFLLPWLLLGALSVPAILGLRHLFARGGSAPSIGMVPRHLRPSREAEPLFFIGDEDDAVVPDEKLAAPNKLVESMPICLVCHAALIGDEVFCTRCRTPHHKECFRYAGSCSVFGCGCRTYRLASRSADPWATDEAVDVFQ